ncbi:MAG: MarR family transcriptional regulator [Chloroflexi bacterium]|nr:MarR family transcriptional regulator [Chloroflexota bacterium]
MTPSPEECAREVLDVVPLVMRAIRAEMRSHRTPDLSVPQFRALLFLRRTPGASLSQVADHLGLTPPSASKLVDGLVARGLLARQDSQTDRRRVVLTVTPAGEAILDSALESTQAHLAETLARLDGDSRAAVISAMRALRTLFRAGGR